AQGTPVAAGAPPVGEAPPQDEGAVKAEAVEVKDEVKRVTKPKPAASSKTAVEPRQRGRLVAFLRSSWAELRRVQWPDRRQVTTMTGVVLGFVVIAGVYLGVIDWAANQVVQLII
ncbi:MAG: preprotein translocase subunit SecE, partial [Solirubrobacterales bacterium]